MNNSFIKSDLLKGVVIGIVLSLHFNLVLAEPIKPWMQLTPIQQEALSPLASQWDSLPPKLQNHLLLSSKQYPKLTSEMKKLFLSRLVKWSKLTPEQRERARQKYLAIGKLSAEKRAQIKRAALDKRIGNSSAKVKIFSLFLPRVHPIFVFESIKMSSLRLSFARNGSNSLKIYPTPKQTHRPSQRELKTSFHQATL